MENKKRIIKNVLIGGLIVWSVTVTAYSLITTALLGKVRIENQKIQSSIRYERTALVNTYETELKDKVLKSVGVINNQLGVIQSKGSVDNKDREIIGDELKTLSNISDMRKELSELNYADITNMNIYNSITDICHSIEKFNVYLAYGLDENNTSAIKCATNEVVNITNLIKEIDNLK